MKRTALLIDGGYLRDTSKRTGLFPDPNFIEEFAWNCFDLKTEDPYRVLYYDCAPYEGTQILPVSQEKYVFGGSDAWLRTLAQRDLFAVRLGELQFRGWKLKNNALERIKTNPVSLSDNDFYPDLEQKGVDMKIGLDIAVLSAKSIVERLIVVTADHDVLPAMRHGRKEGLQIVLVILPGEENRTSINSMLEDTDFARAVPWPKNAKSYQPYQR